MINLKNIIGKKVISIYECKEVGQATNVFIAKNWKCEYIEIIHNNIKYILPIRKISAYKDDSIIIRNISALELKSNLELLLQSNISPIDCRVYSLHGKLLGTIVDVAFNDKLYLDSIRLDDGTEYCRSQILKINDGICIIRDSKKIFTSDFRPRGVPHKKAQYADISVKIVEVDKTCSESKPLEQSSANTTNLTAPYTDIDKTLHDTSNESTNNKLLQHSPNSTTPYSTNIEPVRISDTNMLMGRKCTKNISNINGEIIVHEGDIIGTTHIKNARIYGKIYELVKYSR